MLGVWIEVGKTRGVTLSIPPKDFARYFLAVFIVRSFSIVWVIWEFEWHVNQGRLSPYLLQPMDVGWRWVSAHLSEQAARLPFAALLAILFFCLYPKAMWRPSPGDIALGAVAIYMAFAMRFLLQYTLAMSAFWMERAGALEQMMFLPYLFLSGMIAPLGQYPSAMARVLYWTPFPYMVDFPARILIGEAHRGAAAAAYAPPIGTGMAIVAGWIAVLLLINRWVWRRGLRHYSAMGA
jgi:ABC-2 type transport system permease protein